MSSPLDDILLPFEIIGLFSMDERLDITDDLLGDCDVPGAKVGGLVARVVLRGDHLPRLVLSRQLDLGHRRYVVRRVAEESRRGGTSRRRSS